MTRTGLALLAAAALLLTGCGGSAKPAARSGSTSAPVPSASAPSARCLTSAEAARSMHRVRLADGSEQDAIEYGTGAVGVVLVHQSDGDLCQWDPYARTLAKRGYRTITMSYTGPYLPEAQAAAKELIAAGATSVVLIGASMGGSIVIAAAAVLVPKPVAVVDLSSPQSYGDADATAAVGRLAMPLFFGVARGDPPFYDDVVTLYRHATRSAHRQLAVDHAFAVHGVMLLDEPSVARPMEKFLATYAPPRS